MHKVFLQIKGTQNSTSKILYVYDVDKVWIFIIEKEKYLKNKNTIVIKK